MVIVGSSMRGIAEAVAMSSENSGKVEVDVAGGYLNVDYEKGADSYIEPETGYCNVAGAWCNIKSINYVSEDDEREDIQCDYELLENMVSEFMNN